MKKQHRQLLPSAHEQKSAPRFSTAVMKTENNVLHYLISLPNFPQRSISEFDLIYLKLSSWIWENRLTKLFGPMLNTFRVDGMFFLERGKHQVEFTYHKRCDLACENSFNVLWRSRRGLPNIGVNNGGDVIRVIWALCLEITKIAL